MSELISGQNKKGLGRGLGSLLGSEPSVEKKSSPIEVSKPKALDTAEPMTTNRVYKIQIEKLVPYKGQPRKTFDKVKLEELAASIKERGIIQPILARKKDGVFEIIAGERRWRAAQVAGINEVPVILREDSDLALLETAIVENIQRHDLNPVEEAQAYETLVKKYGLSHEVIAQKVGKDRVTVTNSLRILQLAPSIQQHIIENKLSLGHAKVLLGVADQARQMKLVEQIFKEKMSVRKLEKIVKEEASPKADPLKSVDISESLAMGLGDSLQKELGTKVTIDYDNSKGKISIHFYSDEQLTHLVDRIKGQN